MLRYSSVRFVGGFGRGVYVDGSVGSMRKPVSTKGLMEPSPFVRWRYSRYSFMSIFILSCPHSGEATRRRSCVLCHTRYPTACALPVLCAGCFSVQFRVCSPERPVRLSPCASLLHSASSLSTAED